MKITLNDSIPENRRSKVEAVVKTFAKNPEIVWLPSRFPRLVMFLEPGPEDGSEPERGSIFETPQAGMKSPASVTAQLEERIKACLAAP